MTDVEAGRYQNVVASGTVQGHQRDLQEQRPAAGRENQQRRRLPLITTRLCMQSLNGTAGSSDFAASGTVSNYLGYLFTPGQSLKGNMTVNSRNFNVNEWMVDEVIGQAQRPRQRQRKAPAAAQRRAADSQILRFGAEQRTWIT